MIIEPATYGLKDAPRSRRRGIQPGQVAWSESSQILHGSTETITKAVVERWQKKDPNILWQKKLSVADLIRIARIDADPKTFALNGVAPDGGVVLYRSRERGLVPLFSVEAKDQQNAGNAIERWFKNYTALKMVGPRMAFVTLCTGEGARPDGVICKTLNHAFLEYAVGCREYIPRRWNKLYAEGPSLFRKANGFSVGRIEVLVERLMQQKVADISRR